MDAFSSNEEKFYKFDYQNQDKNIIEISLNNPLKIRGYSIRSAKDRFPNFWKLSFRDSDADKNPKLLHETVSKVEFSNKNEVKIFLTKP